MWCDMASCIVTWCVTWCDVMWCDVRCCAAMWCVVLSCAIWCDVMWSDAMGWDVVWFWCSAVGCEDMCSDAMRLFDMVNWEIVLWLWTTKTHESKTLAKSIPISGRTHKDCGELTSHHNNSVLQSTTPPYKHNAQQLRQTCLLPAQREHSLVSTATEWMTVMRGTRNTWKVQSIPWSNLWAAKHNAITPVILSTHMKRPVHSVEQCGKKNTLELRQSCLIVATHDSSFPVWVIYGCTTIHNHNSHAR